MEARCALASRHPYRDDDLTQALKITEAVLACVNTLWLNRDAPYDRHRVTTAARGVVASVKEATKDREQRENSSKRDAKTKEARATAEANWNHRHLPASKKRPRQAVTHAAKKRRIQDRRTSRAQLKSATKAATVAAAARWPVSQ